MRRWAIINEDTNEEIINLGWFFNGITQRDMDSKLVVGTLNNNERVAVVETDFS